jgi:hypothetical protein
MRHRVRCILSWNSPAVQSFVCLPHIAVIASRNHCVVGRFLDLVVFRNRHRRFRVNEPDLSSLQLRRSSRVLRRSHLAGSCHIVTHQAPLMGFRSLQHIPAERIHSSRAMPDPLRSASRVWLPSWRLAPLTAWPGLFHPDSARGISPFGAFASPRVADAFPRPLDPPAVNPARSPPGRTCRPERGIPTSGLCPLRESLVHRRVFSPRRTGCSLGIPPSRALPSDELPGFHPVSPHTLGRMQQR